LKFFTRRQMRSIHKGQQQRQQRAARLRQDPDESQGRIPVIRALCANLDRMVIVAALQFPEFKSGLIDRLLVMAELECLPAFVVLTKADMCPDREFAERWCSLYSGLGYPTAITSSVSGEGLHTVHRWLEEGRSALCGHSGVGKSTLLGALHPELAPETGDVSEATGKGQHTTTRVRLYRLPGGAELFDLPGLKLAELHCEPSDVARAFPEFLACRCRFRDCLHGEEPGCGVRAGVEEGSVTAVRYESYLRILESL
jgi:ribosome biogenesis GTPase / thiamine phosphate phosphatase